jgi:hypothetical protein
VDPSPYSPIYIYIYLSIQSTQGVNIIRGKWKEQNICPEVNIYPLHPKRPPMDMITLNKEDQNKIILSVNPKHAYSSQS